jgi:hypothetical protein
MTFDPEAVREFERAGWDRAAATYGAAFATVTCQFIDPLLDAASIGTGAKFSIFAAAQEWLERRLWGEGRGLSVWISPPRWWRRHGPGFQPSHSIKATPKRHPTRRRVSTRSSPTLASTMCRGRMLR